MIFVYYGKIMSCPRPRTRVIGTFANIYEPKEYKQWKRLFALAYAKSGDGYKNCAIEVDIKFFFKAPKTMEKYKDQVYGISCTKHKDLDNCIKSVLDALNGVAYEDDKQVVSLTAGKYGTNQCERIELQISLANKHGEMTEEEMHEVGKEEKKNGKTN